MFLLKSASLSSSVVDIADFNIGIDSEKEKVEDKPQQVEAETSSKGNFHIVFVRLLISFLYFCIFISKNFNLSYVFNLMIL